ncbi:hypothetical protein J5N97_008869 [Dioscorea zingiberensis]|uniref:Uncharacterized protein n=1 Tax=Dioscorea zingiberensis TaxID=325984 RepID=A0A9D5HL59_9LILI|nr:hypothetical protein J5N97_008869 [Dioscorea zingiberensis]
METDSWNRFSSERHQPSLQSRFSFEELDGSDDETRMEFPCPFCHEDFDIVGLCCHIDEEHPAGGRNGVCPVCAVSVAVDMVGHITMQHGSYFKISFHLPLTYMHHRRRFHKGLAGAHSIPFLSKAENRYREVYLESFRGGSSNSSVSSNAVPDPLLSSFILSMPVADSLKDILVESLDESGVTDKISDENVAESVEPSMPDQNQQERAQRSEFVRELVLSMIFEDTI